MGRLIYFIPIWAVFMALKLVVAVLGLVMIPVLYRWRYVPFSQMPWWSKPWANPEDWTGGPMTHADSLPKWWIDKEGYSFKSFFVYHAIRNPANGLRNYEALDLDIDMDRVEYKTPQYFNYYEPWHFRKIDPQPKTGYYLAWQGLRAGFKIVHIWNDERHLVIKLGWRIEPRDKHEPLNPAGQRIHGAGFASKALLYRNG